MRRIVFSLIVLLFAGCATVFSGTHDTLTINSNPQGAMVFIDGLEYGRTPATFTLKRDAMRPNGKTVTLKKDGYRDRSFQLQKEFNFVSICNLGNAVFWAIDFVSGALFYYEPLVYTVTLEPAETQAAVPFYLAAASEGCRAIPL